MLIDLTISNFRSFKDDQMLSMVAENNLNRHQDNFALIEDDKIAVLRSAVIVGPNASGKSNILKAIHALKWFAVWSGDNKEGDRLLPYEPYKLHAANLSKPVSFEIEFVVPSGMRYRYELSFDRERVLTETLHSFPKRQQALIFERGADDTWETIKFGGTYKGGARRIPFFPNNSYLSKAGNDASTPESIREIVRYFKSIIVINTASARSSAKFYEKPSNLEAISNLLCLVDTGINEVTSEENEDLAGIKFPDSMPTELREQILDENKLTFSFWVKDDSGASVKFEEDEISDGTLKLFHLMPVLMSGLLRGIPVFVDELDGHLHTNIVTLIMDIFNDPELNIHGSQLIFTTHDTNVLDPNKLRRDQIWLINKDLGTSMLQALDNFDKKYIRPDSPFEDFYISGRFGALPQIDISRIRKAILGKLLNEPTQPEVQ